MPARHRLDTFALTVGLLCLAGSGLALAARADVAEVDALVALAVLWLVLGAVGVSRSVARLLRRTPEVEEGRPLSG
jgi:hypothetical protein